MGWVTRPSAPPPRVRACAGATDNRPVRLLLVRFTYALSALALLLAFLASLPVAPPPRPRPPRRA